MRISDVCERHSIEVWGIFDMLTKVDAWCMGGWAAHRQLADPDRWCLTLAHLGLSLPLVWASFTSAAEAVTAMRRIVTLRNDWHRVRQADLTKELAGRLKVICAEAGAVRGPIQLVQHADRSFLGVDIVAAAHRTGEGRGSSWRE